MAEPMCVYNRVPRINIGHEILRKKEKKCQFLEADHRHRGLNNG